MNEEEMVAMFWYFVGIVPRTADLAVMRILGSSEQTTAEYIWDHWLGEPEDTSPEAMVKEWNDNRDAYKQD